MIDIKQILSGDNATDVITALKERTTPPTKWEDLVTEYEPKKHEIVDDHQGRKDKIHPDGSTDKAARLYIGMEKLLTNRMAEFTFAIPVKRTYSNAETDAQQAIAKALERIYTVAHIDSENKERAKKYYASCEILTVWYVKRETHNLYGFPCNYKLKCKTFSPMDGVSLWPLIDDRGEMYAMSYEYTKKVKDEMVTYFETFTSDEHRIWKHSQDAKWEAVKSDAFDIGKIPAIYLYRPAPVWDGLTELRKDIEYNLSRNSDVIAYNCAPILKVAGSIIGDEKKGETRRVYRVTEGGDVSYVSWAQSIAALQYHVETLKNLFWTQAQMPDISFEKMMALGNIGYDARKTLLTDAHLKIGDESGAWLEFLERENSVLKAFLKKINVGFRPEDVDSILIENTITPYIQEDDNVAIDKWLKASGGNPLVSTKDAIKKANLTDDAERTYTEIMEELAQKAQLAAAVKAQG